jgi:hypothetical protein
MNGVPHLRRHGSSWVSAIEAPGNELLPLHVSTEYVMANMLVR